MKLYSKFIHLSKITHLPTRLPAQFFGLPDNSVYVIFKRFYEVEYDRGDVEIVFARHKEFTFDYENEKLIFRDNNSQDLPVSYEVVDKPEPQIEILEVCRDCQSFSQAIEQLNQRAREISLSKEQKTGRSNQSSFNKGIQNTTFPN